MHAIQEFLQWAAGLPPLAKGLISLVAVALCGFVLSVLWSKPVPAAITSALVPAPASVPAATHPSVPVSPSPMPILNRDVNPEAKDMWPNDKSMDGLQKRLRNISRENARILVNVTNAGQYGLYMGDICKTFALSRNDATARVETLKTMDL
jgi:hypothetical protein